LAKIKLKQITNKLNEITWEPVVDVVVVDVVVEVVVDDVVVTGVAEQEVGQVLVAVQSAQPAEALVKI